ncbi:hypothetical protein MCCC1A01412_00055 [Bacillus anthracis]|uniref:hypothetical protein n=1 Tax=Bacillus anthracis TaxID=1392 RepID=UPI0008FE80A3|nr:hypothetical protein [Bacillus anthracis]AXO92833.1 hypothetical protein DY471_10585 [Bacillus anthracis]OJD98494.1 hypothetical protein MCCC1A01412_00055 [Bacillus anthracis]
MEKKINIFEEFNKIGEQMIEQIAKGLKESTNETMPIDNTYMKSTNDQMEQVYEEYKTIGEMLFYMKEGLVDAGFTEDQAMQFVIREYLEQRAESKG